MKKFIFLTIFIFSNINGQAQKIAYYKVAIIYDNGKRENGWLYDFNENEISLADLKTNLAKDLSENKPLSIKKIAITSDIKRIVLRRKDRFLRTLGTLTGISIGGGLLVGYLSGDSKNGRNEWFPTWESKALIAGLIGMYGTLYATIPLSILPNKVVYKRKIIENNLSKEFEKYTLVSQLNKLKVLDNLTKPN